MYMYYTVHVLSTAAYHGRLWHSPLFHHRQTPRCHTPHWRYAHSLPRACGGRASAWHALSHCPAPHGSGPLGGYSYQHQHYQQQQPWREERRGTCTCKCLQHYMHLKQISSKSSSTYKYMYIIGLFI